MGFKFPYSAPTQTLAFKHVDINDTAEGNTHMAQTKYHIEELR